MTNKRPLISICIPTYNRETYLWKCIESIVTQEWFNKEEIEIVVSDNNSTDKTEKIVEKYQKAYGIKYFKNKNNIWANPNILKVMWYGSWKYIRSMGDDDIILKWWLQYVINIIKNYNGISFFQTNSFTKKNKEIIIYKDWIEYFKEIIYSWNRVLNLLSFSFISTLIIEREKMNKHITYRQKFSSESYSHTCLILDSIYKNKIWLLGQVIWWWNGEMSEDYRRFNTKKRYEVVITNGMDKILTHRDHFSKMNLSYREFKKYRSYFIKTHFLLKIFMLSKKFWLYTFMMSLYKKYTKK